MVNCKKLEKFYKIILICLSAAMPVIALASITIYHYTETTAGRASHDYSTESSCANVNKTGRENHKDSCAASMGLKQQIAEQEPTNKSVISSHSDGEHLIG